MRRTSDPCIAGGTERNIALKRGSENETSARRSGSTLPEILQGPIRRLQRRRALHGALSTLWLSLAGALLILAIARYRPLPHWRLWAALPPLLWALSHGVRYPTLRTSEIDAACRLDRELGLKERLVTALELGYGDGDTPLQAAQQADAQAYARQITPAQDLPWQIPRRALALAGGLFAMALLLFFLPNPQDAVLQQQAALRQAADEQAAQIEALAEEVAKLEGLSPEEREELVRQLEEAAEELRRNPGQVEEAVADLEAVREALRRRLERAEERQEAVDAVEEALREVARELGRGDEEALEEILAGLETLPEALEGMSEEEIAELAKRFEELARRAAADPELARSLEALAEAVESADPEAVARAVEAMAEALERAETELAAQAELEVTLEELEATGETLAGPAGCEGGEGAGDEGQADAGEGDGPGGAGEGSGEGGGAGEDGSAGAGGDWYDDPNRPNEGEAGPPEEEVYVPLGPDGLPAYVPGQPDEQAGQDTTTLPVPDPGEEGVAVPYEVVYRHYREAAGRAMERSYIPPGLRSYIRDYFAELEP